MREIGVISPFAGFSPILSYLWHKIKFSLKNVVSLRLDSPNLGVR